MTTHEKLKELGLTRRKLGEFFGYKPGSLDNSTRIDLFEAGVLKVVEHVISHMNEGKPNDGATRERCSVCGSTNVTEAPGMGMNCNVCNPRK